MTDFIRHLRRVVPSGELLQIPSVTVVLRDGAGRVLLARHADNNEWLLVGGSIEAGESPADAAVREMWEETRLVVTLTKLVGVFGGADYIIRYRNGDRTSYVTTVFEAKGDDSCAELHLDNAELLEVRFVARHELSGLVKANWVLEVLDAVFRDEHRAIFSAPSWTPPA
jgi:8-oxo-dGTP pyrophosphatase MutT (NUDIX family)